MIVITINGAKVECSDPNEAAKLLNSLGKKSLEPTYEKRTYKRKIKRTRASWTYEEVKALMAHKDEPTREICKYIHTRTYHAVGYMRSVLTGKRPQLVTAPIQEILDRIKAEQG